MKPMSQSDIEAELLVQRSMLIALARKAQHGDTDFLAEFQGFITSAVQDANQEGHHEYVQKVTKSAEELTAYVGPLRQSGDM